MPDTMWYFQPHNDEIITYSLAQWTKLKERKKVVELNITDILLPEHLTVFYQNLGLVTLTTVMKQRNIPGHVRVSVPGDSNHYYCKRKNWPTETPGVIVLAYSCKDCREKQWLTSESMTEIFSLGLYCLIDVTFQGHKALEVLHAPLVQKRSFKVKAYETLVKDNIDILAHSPAFMDYIGLIEAKKVSNFCPDTIPELRNIIVDELKEKLSLNSQPIDFLGRTISPLTTLKIFADNETLLLKVFILGQTVKMARVAQTITVNIATDSQDSNCYENSFDQVIVAENNGNDQPSPVQSITSCPFGPLSGSESGSPTQGMTQRENINAMKIRNIGLDIPSSGYLQQPQDLHPFELYKSVRKQCLKNFLDGDYFFQAGDLAFPTAEEVSTNINDLIDLDAKARKAETFFNALDLEVSDMQKEHLTYRRKLYKKSAGKKLDSNSIVKRDIYKINTRIAKLDSLGLKIGQTKIKTLKTLGEIRDALLKQDLEKFQNLKFFIMQPLEEHYRAFFWFAKRENPIKGGLIGSTDFPDRSLIATEFGTSFYNFYESSMQATINGMQNLFAQAKSIFELFQKFNNDLEQILDSDKKSEDKATELLTKMQQYGGQTHIVQDRVRFNQFSVFKTGNLEEPVSIPQQESIDSQSPVRDENTTAFSSEPSFLYNRTPTPLRRRDTNRQVNNGTPGRTRIQSMLQSRLNSTLDISGLSVSPSNENIANPSIQTENVTRKRAHSSLESTPRSNRSTFRLSSPLKRQIFAKKSKFD